MSKREHTKAEKAAFDYQKAQLAITNIEAEKKAAIAKIDAQYAKELEAAQSAAKEAEETLEQYARKYRNEIFLKDEKTTTLGPISVSLKLNNPSIGIIGDLKPAAVVAKLKKYLPAYVRVSESMDKRKLLSDQEKITKEMKKCGLEVVQEERFEIKL
ncbi:host-nuclease inhibitor Gam family protein [Flavilitoribacter nigricans]|uniref:Uncharacterized protein n=1 Tax=Flavilitoribacter nigricans (strain ATCC 23147 / DSM 23189 / NBRC 102662 / NCIMB 1420 / SS-2) TaxID=1122177 RepID=A0A2D0MWZ9_FLAN2|nr:host-nuclease inhibitor Gam family protein [Flavilitoribacter nigricans]PHN00656.1 hypothetical protein CRP01_41075 [Flavilitoribacter nigricans DSM 23189 = NBRC 102662]